LLAAPVEDDQQPDHAQTPLRDHNGLHT
jgi:hypothetical protein